MLKHAIFLRILKKKFYNIQLLVHLVRVKVVSQICLPPLGFVLIFKRL